MYQLQKSGICMILFYLKHFPLAVPNLAFVHCSGKILIVCVFFMPSMIVCKPAIFNIKLHIYTLQKYMNPIIFLSPTSLCYYYVSRPKYSVISLVMQATLIFLAASCKRFVVLKILLSFSSIGNIWSRDDKDLLGHLSNLQKKISIEHLIAFCFLEIQIS